MATFRRYTPYIKIDSSKRYAYLSVRNSYIEIKYGIPKFIYNYDITDNYQSIESINPEWKMFIDNYLLNRKLKNKLPIKNTKTKGKKI